MCAASFLVQNGCSFIPRRVFDNDGTFTLAKDAQTLTFRESTGRVIVVPEPGTALLGVLGVLAALASRRGDGAW